MTDRRTDKRDHKLEVEIVATILLTDITVEMWNAEIFSLVSNELFSLVIFSSAKWAGSNSCYFIQEAIRGLLGLSLEKIRV